MAKNFQIKVTFASPWLALPQFSKKEEKKEEPEIYNDPPLFLDKNSNKTPQKDSQNLMSNYSKEGKRNTDCNTKINYTKYILNSLQKSMKYE